VVGGDSVEVGVLFNDEDPDGDPLTLEIVAGPDPALGNASTGGGAIRFSSVPGAVGTAQIGYRIGDGEFVADAVVRITVLPCSQGAPVAPDVFLQTGYVQPIAVDLNAYAVNGAVVAVGPPLAAASGVVTPQPGENGNIVFTYTVANVCDQRDTGTVTIDVNQDPVAQPYAAELARTEQRTIPVSDLATDLELLTLAALGGAPPWATIASGGSELLLAPAGAPAGTYGFTATVADPGGLSVVVDVRVTLINRTPTANPDEVDATDGPVTFSPLDNDTDPDGDPLAVQAFPATITFENGETGTVTAVGTDQLLVDPGAGGGVATFTYTAVDPGGLVSEPATVTVRVNRPPTAEDVFAVIPPDTATAVPLDASDPDGDRLVVTLDGVPDDVVVTVANLTVTITAPTRRPFGFDYTVTDPSGAAATARVRIVVSDEPAPPEPS
jgi:hypothetical protein